MSGRAGSHSTVAEMGMNPDVVKKLTPAGQKITKADLISLWSNKVSETTSKATLGDIEVIKQAFLQAAGATSASARLSEVGDVNCCCCPCCCATAVIKPIRAVA